MKKRATIICALMLVGISILLTLYAFSPLNEKLYRGAFERTFLEKPLSLISKINLKYNSFYFAGTTKNRIYLGNNTSPFYLLSFNNALADSQLIHMKIKKLDSIKYVNQIRTTIDSPMFYMTHATLPAIFGGSMTDWTAKDLYPGTEDFFLDAVPMSLSSFALRSFSTENNGYELAKKTTSPPYFQFQEDLLKKQVDGIFCLDGQLLYSKQKKRLVYIHFYRNEVVIADTNMNLIARQRTLDTITTANVVVSKTSSDGQKSLSRPAFQVNLLSVIDGNTIFIRSNTMSHTEDESTFKKNSVIDVFKIDKWNYVGSFYIPEFDEQKVRYFTISGNSVYALYGNYLVQYDLPKIFENIPTPL